MQKVNDALKLIEKENLEQQLIKELVGIVGSNMRRFKQHFATEAYPLEAILYKREVLSSLIHSRLTLILLNILLDDNEDIELNEINGIEFFQKKNSGIIL